MKGMALLGTMGSYTIPPQGAPNDLWRQSLAEPLAWDLRGPLGGPQMFAKAGLPGRGKNNATFPPDAP